MVFLAASRQVTCVLPGSGPLKAVTLPRYLNSQISVFCFLSIDHFMSGLVCACVCLCQFLAAIGCVDFHLAFPIRKLKGWADPCFEVDIQTCLASVPNDLHSSPQTGQWPRPQRTSDNVRSPQPSVVFFQPSVKYVQTPKLLFLHPVHSMTNFTSPFNLAAPQDGLGLRQRLPIDKEHLRKN